MDIRESQKILELVQRRSEGTLSLEEVKAKYQAGKRRIRAGRGEAMSIVDERKDRKASKRCPKAHHMKYSMTTDEQELMKTGSDPNRLDRHERGDLLMRTLTELPAEISDFLLTVALGNSEPDNLAMDAVELLEAFGVKMTKITKGQYVEKR